MTEPRGEFGLYFVHQDQVMALPDEAELLGGNAFCPNAMFVMGDQVLGVQGHPEFTKPIMEDILAGKDGVVDAAVVETAVSSIHTITPDNDTFAHWIVNFLTLQTT
jgi:GMP synthase-like glutamine amidotransferase